MRDWLKIKRQDLGLSCGEVAKKIGISRQYYSMIELGNRRPTPEVAKRIAAVIGIDWARFFDEQQAS